MATSAAHAVPATAATTTTHVKAGQLTPLAQTLGVASAAALVKLGSALPYLGRYGWDRDELYFLQASHHLSLGYVDFPFVTALIGRVTLDLAGPSLIALRLTGVLAAMVVTVLIALSARELGGGLPAQLVGALAFVLTPYGLGLGMLFHPTMFDALVWAGFAYVALRILRRPEPRWWPLLGLIAGVGVETKGTILALLFAFVAGLWVFGPRSAFRDRRAWLAGAIAVGCAIPYVAWECAHGWPSLTFLPTQDAATAAATSRLSYVAQQLAFLGATLTLVVAGTVSLWGQRRLRSLAVLAPAIAILFLIERGRSYYALPAIVIPLAAGAVTAEAWWARTSRRWLLVPLLAVQVTSLAIAAPLVWPVLSTSAMVRAGVWRPSFYKDELGWPELVAQTARVWRNLTPGRRAQSVLLAHNYGEAGALDLYGPALGLPLAVSGHLSFQYWHPRHLDKRYLLVVGYSQTALHGLCSASQVRGRVSNRWKVANEEQGALIATCRLRRPLGALWDSHIATDRL